MNFSFKHGRFSFQDKNGHGWNGFLFEFNGQLSPSLSCTQQQIDEQGGEVILEGEQHREILRFSVDSQRGALTVSRTLVNNGTSPLPVESVSDGLLDEQASLQLPGEFRPIDYYRLRYFHGSNCRTEKLPRFRAEHPYLRCIPYDPVHFNHDEANHLPAFGICNERDGSTHLVEGDLNQLQFERSWELALEGPAGDGLIRHCKGMQRYTLSHGFQLEPGEQVELSRVFYQIKKDSQIQNAFEDYIDTLGQMHAFRGSRTRMRSEGIYCTWNYGVYANIDENNLLERARLLREKIPNCTHFLIDDGFQAKRNDRNAGICSFYPTPVKGYDKEKFPGGMKALADQIRALGLKPCIWLSPKIYLDSDLAREQPEWLLRDAEGSAALIGESSFLDLSVPAARDFYLQVLDALFVEWGYEGIKYDFMTQWFLLEKSRFREGSGLEWRDFAFRAIRERIGDDGFFMTCIAFSAGNPFPGLHADCYRAGFDIHEGSWNEQVRACSGTLPALLIEGKKTLLLNMDSAGFNDIPANEQRFRFNWCFITQGILEIGGKLENHSDEQFAIFNRLLANTDRGNKVHVLDNGALTGEGLPEILQVRYEDEGAMQKAGITQHLAFFNWSNEPRRLSIACQRAGLPASGTLLDHWEESPLTFDSGFVSVDLAPRSSALFAQHC